METEQIYQNKIAHTIQQKQNREGTLEFEDNRPNEILQSVAVQREEEGDEEDILQGKFEQPVQKKDETGLPDDLKAGIENLSGFATDNIRVHYNSDKPSLFHALAYTQGTNIYLASGQEQHLPHEAWHWVQQMNGRVEPTTEIGGMPVNDNAELEHEADIMGARANNS